MYVVSHRLQVMLKARGKTNRGLFPMQDDLQTLLVRSLSAFLLLVSIGLHHNHNILLVVFRTTLVYHDDVPNQEFNPCMKMRETLPYHFMLSKGYYLLFPAEKVQHLLKGNTKINPHFVGYIITSIMTPTSTVFVTLIRKAITCTQPSICWVGIENIS